MLLNSQTNKKVERIRCSDNAFCATLYIQQMRPTTTIRIDSKEKENANAIFQEIGISFSVAINIFLKAVIREGRIPFEMSTKKERLVSSRNTMLNNAFVNKKDEFYTMYEDIEKEMVNHTSQFFGKAVLCNCDDPYESAFFRYFVLNFNNLKLASLTATSYAHSSLSKNNVLTKEKGTKIIIKEIPPTSFAKTNKEIDLNELLKLPQNTFEELNGDGDFRSKECLSILNSADIVVTNPPFSLFREYLGLLINSNKQFLILGNMNAVTCKEVFPLFQTNKLWYGESIKSGDRKFYVPDDYPLNASNCGVDDSGRRYIRVKGIRWFTNLDTNCRHNQLALSQKYNPKQFPKYDNYNAIDVKKTVDIPDDYNGVMGVPITFLDKYCPDQFDIIMLANGNSRTNTPKDILDALGYRQHPEDRGGVGIIDGKRTYARVMIKRKNK